MNKEQLDRVRLEERARILAQASEEVNKMLKEMSASGKNPETPKTKPVATKKKPVAKKKQNSQQAARVSSSLSNLSTSQPCSNEHPAARNKIGNYQNTNLNQAQQSTLPYPPTYDEAVQNKVFYQPNVPMVSPLGSLGLANNNNQYHHPRSSVSFQMFSAVTTQKLPNMKNKSHQNSELQKPTSLPQKATAQIKSKPVKKIQNSTSSNKDLKQLVHELVKFPGFFTTIENLSKILKKSCADVLIIVNNNRKIFSILKNVSPNKVKVELRPKIKLCPEHFEELGCKGANCTSLHICSDYVKECCIVKSCIYGHIWKTGHNIRILKEFQIDDLQNNVMQILMRKILDGAIMPEICSYYNQHGCKHDNDCTELHICYSFVETLGNCQNQPPCIFNHNIFDTKCVALLKHFGISTNETARDILKVLKGKCIREEDLKKIESSNDINLISLEKDNLKRETANNDKQINLKDDTAQKLKKRAVRIKKVKTIGMVHNWHLSGNVVEPKICKDGINMQCTDLECKLLHSISTCYWQFGFNSKWFNFHLHHSLLLETMYRDVNCDEVTLPKLDPAQVEKPQIALFALLGSKDCKVDFQNMKINCEGTNKIYSIRLLTTDSSAICDNKFSTTFNWYFKNNDDIWELFENSYSSSSLIEKLYLENPNEICIYSCPASKYDYKINFFEMTQENLLTKKIRPIKRRLESITDADTGKEENFELPSNWDAMNANNGYTLISLSSSHDEYKEIRQIFSLTLPMVDIVDISRIQNLQAWKSFKNKQIELEKKYNTIYLNVQKLFRGIDAEFIEEICKNKTEFGLHDIRAESTLYGYGAYFYNRASAGAAKSKINPMGYKYLLVVDVIIGKFTLGQPGFMRPPENPDFQSLFDTTTDSVTNPTVFVKYNREEYYPSYLVKFQ